MLCHAKNVQEIHYQYEDEVEAPASSGKTVDAPTIVASTAPIAANTTVSAPSSGPVLSIADIPLIKPIDILLVIITQKLKKGVDQIPLSKTSKDLVGGRSTLQNEVFGDLQQEFASAPEKGEELPLEELGSALGSFSGALGKYSTGLVSRLIGGKMPGGFNSSAIKSYFSKNLGLGSSRSDGVLLGQAAQFLAISAIGGSGDNIVST
jgi:fatty acid synthase subunit beta